MYHLCLTLETPAANLALDEALLDAAETGHLDDDALRLWESPAPCVVLGRSSPPSEVRIDACEADGVAVLQRSSGGGAVAIGPGCLMYALVLNRELHPELSSINGAHRLVLSRLADALAPLAAGVVCAGTSDLAIQIDVGQLPRKFSGNSLRARRGHLLYHGTLLYDFQLSNIARWLGAPTRQPDYRQGRTHDEFVTNLPVAYETLVAALSAAWQAREPLPSLVEQRVLKVAAHRANDPCR